MVNLPLISDKAALQDTKIAELKPISSPPTMSVRHEIERRNYGEHMPHMPPSRHLAHRKSSILVGQRSLEIIEESGQKEPTYVFNTHLFLISLKADTFACNY
ncbi:unnamed protein product [Enterobius vermicularis]|uniref:Uncharacterized protein n=1 Tax=Enterobius vermicularis TaxID=51028 RepID=A0A0N4VMF0_ENTVE|nr:unnamed protein product [Enterobius vermicularis]